MSPAAAVHVRVATTGDAPLLLPMFEAFYGNYFRPKTVEAIREHMAAASAVDLVLIAEDGGVPVGFASLRLIPQIESDSPHAELSDLFVEARRRREGIGRALMAFAERTAREHGSPHLFLVTGFDNPGAQAFYRRIGFADHAVQMQKDLGGGP